MGEATGFLKWGRQTPTDSRIPQLMKLGAESRFHWALLYEQEGQGDPSSSQIGSDLRYVRTHYASNSAYLQNMARNTTSFAVTYGAFAYLGANAAHKVGIEFNGASVTGSISSSTLRNGFYGINLANSVSVT